MSGRARGSDAEILFRWNDGAYGEIPTLGAGEHYLKMPAVKFGLSEGDSLEADPEIGMGRDAQDPARGALEDSGDLEVVVDQAHFGYWLRALLGDAVATAVKAAGSITFAANPAAGSTITLAGTVWTFVDSGPAGNQTDLGETLAATLAQLALDLNASVVPAIAAATYAATATALTIEFDTAGSAGNAYTLAASAATVSAATLTGGGWSHVWQSGAASLPDFVVEAGLASMDQPSFFRHYGVKAGTLAISRSRTGSVHATIGLTAQGETIADAPLDAAPVALEGRRKFQQQRGSITRGGLALGNTVGGSLTYGNNLDPVATVDRPDGRISGLDEGESTATGEVVARFANRTLLDKASADEPVDITYAFAHPSGATLTFAFARVHLPKPKRTIEGPGAIETTYAWQAAGDRDGGNPLMTVTLLSPVVDDYGAMPGA